MTSPTDRAGLKPHAGPDLDAAARAYHVPAGDVAAVAARAHGRTTRRQRALAVLSVASLVGAGTVSVDLLDGDGATTVSSGAALVRGEVGVSWRAVTPASGLGLTATAPEPGAGAPLYALSTAPGLADLRGDAAFARVVWRSDDGVEWTAVSALDADLFASDLSARDGRVYAVGTGPAAAAVGGRRPFSPLLVGWSDDGARTWQRAPLPMDMGAIAARTVRSAVRSTAVAAGPAGTVVVGVLDATLDVAAALPPGVGAPHGWAATASGVDLLGPDRGVTCPEGTSPAEGADQRWPADPASGEVHPAWCERRGGADGAPVAVSPQDGRGVTTSYTWAELGVGGDLLRAVRRQPVAFLAPAGGERFERVELPAAAGVIVSVLADASEAGFHLVTTAAGDARGKGAVTVVSSPDGRAWSVDDGLPLAWAAAAGRVGGAITVVGDHGEGGPAVARSDGAGGWSVAPLAAAAGAGEGGRVGLGAAAVGPFGVVAAVILAPKGSERGPTEPRLVFSRDGRTWDDVAVADLAGRPVRSVIRAAVVGERALVAVSVVAPDGDRPDQVVLVGTPT